MHARETRKPRLFRPRPAPLRPLVWLYVVATLVLALVFTLAPAHAGDHYAGFVGVDLAEFLRHHHRYGIEKHLPQVDCASHGPQIAQKEIGLQLPLLHQHLPRLYFLKSLTLIDNNY